MKIYLASKSPRRKEFLTLMGLKYDCFPSEKDEEIIIKQLTEENLQQKNVVDKKTTSKETNEDSDLLNRISEKLAEQKAEDIFSQTEGDRIVIGSDTLVCYGSNYFGKPKNINEAREMLKILSGSWHYVISSLCVIVSRNGEIKKYLDHSKTRVKFIKLSNEMIERYISRGEDNNKLLVTSENIQHLKDAGWLDENGNWKTDNGNQPECLDKAGAYAIQGKASIFIEKIEGSYTSVIGLPTHILYDILSKENII